MTVMKHPCVLHPPADIWAASFTVYECCCLYLSLSAELEPSCCCENEGWKEVEARAPLEYKDDGHSEDPWAPGLCCADKPRPDGNNMKKIILCVVKNLRKKA